MYKFFSIFAVVFLVLLYINITVFSQHPLRIILELFNTKVPAVSICENIVFGKYSPEAALVKIFFVKQAKNNNAILLTTEKDYLRIDENYRENIKYVKINVEIENRKEFIEVIKKII